MNRWILALLVFAASLAQAQQVALTFDDGLDPLREPEAAQWNRDMLRHLRDAKVQAMLFPALARIGGEPGLELVRDWPREGHDVGNHTASHRNLASSKMPLGDFIADVQRGHETLSAVARFRPMLRFPFLKEGDTPEKRDGMREWMREHGYRAAPVSIDTSDWYFNKLYRDAAGDAKKRDAIARAYVEHIADRASYYDRIATRVLGRSPAHVLLLHTSAINADTLPQLIDALRKVGWKIVSPGEAFEDPLYRMQPDVLPAGESIVWSLAKKAGVEGLRYPAEDARYEEPRMRALGLAQ